MPIYYGPEGMRQMPGYYNYPLNENNFRNMNNNNYMIPNRNNNIHNFQNMQQVKNYNMMPFPNKVQKIIIKFSMVEKMDFN